MKAAHLVHLAILLSACSSSTSSAPPDALDAPIGGEAVVDSRPFDAALATDQQAANQDANQDASSAFVHPGLLHTEADFERMRSKVDAKASPWTDGWKLLIDNRHADLKWTPNPQTEIHRNDGMNSDNYMTFVNDVAAAYACALRWKVSDDERYADKAVEILNAWAGKLTTITWSDGHYDGSLVAGIQGYQIVNAAEIMRTYSRWAAADFARFQDMIRRVFYPANTGILRTPSSLLVYSNWDLAALDADLAIAVLLDDRDLFDATIAYFKTGLGNGGITRTVHYLHPGHLGQTQESGRDQGHNTLSMTLLTTLCEMAWNQGVDLYGYDNNRVLAGAEYVARGNLIESGTSYYSMPFAKYTNGNVTDTVFADGSRGSKRPEWTLIFNHYVNRKGLAAPYSEAFMLLTQPEGGGGNYGETSGGYDQLGYGTLAYIRDPIARGAAPSGLVAHVSQGMVTLSWWGTAHATAYAVKRGTRSGGPYEVVTSGLSGLLTYTDAPPVGTYYYVVTATAPSGESSSNEVRAVTATQLHTQLQFDDGSGSRAVDASGEGHIGTLMAGAAWGAGKNGGGVALDGKASYVELPRDLLAHMGDFTIAAWVYAGRAADNARIFDFGTNSGSYMMLTGWKTIRFAITTNGTVGEQQIKGSAPLPTGRWVHVAVTLTGKTGTLYVDKAAVGTNPDLQLPPFQLGPTSQNWLGRSQYASDPYFTGMIDDLRIYYGALSAEQIAEL